MQNNNDGLYGGDCHPQPQYHVQRVLVRGDRYDGTRAVRAFPSLYEAVGYMTAYVACTGSTALVYGKKNECSYVAERERFGLVNVRSFGPAAEALNYVQHVPDYSGARK